MSCPTVKIQCDNEQGFIIINESDFDEGSHELFEEKTNEDSGPKEGSKAWHVIQLTELGAEFDDSQPAKELKELFESIEK